MSNSVIRNAQNGPEGHRTDVRLGNIPAHGAKYEITAIPSATQSVLICKEPAYELAA